MNARSSLARAPRRSRTPLGLILLCAAALTLDLWGCRAARVAAVPPVEPRASLAFAEAQELLRAGDDVAARAAFAEAARLAPAWIAPARALDDFDREMLLGPRVYARRKGEFEEEPSAGAQYLIGRLEGAAGVARFQRGVELDPELAWNHHGIAWNLLLSGSPRRALRPGRRALSLARDTWERTYFTVALARYELSLARPDRAAAVLTERLNEPDVLALDRGTLSTWLAQAEMLTPDPARAARGRRRALELIAEASLSEEELGRLVSAVRAAPLGLLRGGLQASDLELATALAGPAARGGELARRLRAAVLFELERPALALALLREEPGAAVATDRRLRIARFARGGGRQAIADWVRSLPAFTKDASGAPRDPFLRALSAAAEVGDDRALAEALLDAGWFAEAHAFAEDLAARDPYAGLDLEARAAAGVVLLDGVRAVLELVDRGEPYGGALARATPEGAEHAPFFEDSGEPHTIDDLDALLAALDPLFATYRASLEPAGDSTEAAPSLVGSPRSKYGPVATVVHPGPNLSPADEERGLGNAGAPVPGLAAELARIGRFGLFGNALGGGGPDGTLLRRVWIEERSGEHLGVPWSGTVAWCDGADVESRPGRRGARISGAALHEGYWVDLDVIRGELAAWRRLREDFIEPDAAAAARRALAQEGVPVADVLGASAADPVALLDEGDRLRLAILLERAAARPDASELVTLGELAELTALHEEGHLTDRTRFLPLEQNLAAVFGFLASAGFSPGGVARALEERAQLIALCEAPDPRLPLAEVLGSSEHGSSVTPHSAAYTTLLADWLEELGRLARDPERFPRLDRGRYFAHQLHRLTPEEVRRVSRSLADRQGLIRD